ncbi:cholinephosphotransferase 1-like [Diadema setosum]|uniref:cholinephosphotransferase 1-like n=1 Tax=Diadema setosum TaxID=31175 RepID=UPI003B3A58CB
MTPAPILDGLRSMEVLSQQELKRLKEHKYSSEGKSITEPVMQVFWCWLVEQIPRTLAPNTITIIGLVANIVSTLILVYYCPSATEEAPAWSLIFAALCLFIYQSLDAIDGKQARRTNSSTQLGELFDHGCDAVSIVFVTVSASVALQLGFNPRLNFVLAAISMFLYYTAHWQTYVSGTLKFGRVDVTEGQLAFCTVYIITAIQGGDFWKMQVPVLDMELKVVTCLFGLSISLMSIYNYGRIIFGGGKGRNGSTVADTSVIAPFFHIGSVILLAFAIWQKSKTGIFERQPCVYMIVFGLVAAKITIKLVVAHMTRSGMNFLDTAFIAPGLLFINQYLDTFVSEDRVLWLALAWSVFDLSRFCIALCQQISQHLGIYTFDITSKPAPMDQRVGVTTRRQAKLATR